MRQSRCQYIVGSEAFEIRLSFGIKNMCSWVLRRWKSAIHKQVQVHTNSQS